MDPTATLSPLQAHIAELHALWHGIQNQLPEQLAAAMAQSHLAAIPADWSHWSTEKQQVHLGELRQRFRLGVEQFHQHFTRLAASMRAPSECATDPGPGDIPFRIDRLLQFPDQRPLFVLGIQRSGTTAIGNALRQAPRIFGWLEGHIFSKLPHLLRAIARTWSQRLQAENTDRTPDIALTHLDVHRFLNQTIHVFNQFYVEAVALAGAERWMDRTPGFYQLSAVPLLHHVYPQARFLFLHRHPLKRILSRLRYPGPKPSIELAMLSWVLTMDLWTQLRRQLPPQSYRDVAQTDLSLRTDELIAQLGPFLGLEADQTEAVRDYLTHERPQSTGSSRDSDEYHLEDFDWSEEVKVWCREMGESTALAWGYHLTRT